jgi:hypothetical protein
VFVSEAMPVETQKQVPRGRRSRVMQQASFRVHRRSSAVQALFSRDSLKIRHLRAESTTVHLRSSVEDLLGQVVGTPLQGAGEDRQVYCHYLGLSGVVLTMVCGQLALGR